MWQRVNKRAQLRQVLIWRKIIWIVSTFLSNHLDFSVTFFTEYQFFGSPISFFDLPLLHKLILQSHSSGANKWTKMEEWHKSNVRLRRRLLSWWYYGLSIYDVTHERMIAFCDEWMSRGEYWTELTWPTRHVAWGSESHQMGYFVMKIMDVTLDPGNRHVFLKMNDVSLFSSSIIYASHLICNFTDVFC